MGPSRIWLCKYLFTKNGVYRSHENTYIILVKFKRLMLLKKNPGQVGLGNGYAGCGQFEVKHKKERKTYEVFSDCKVARCC